MEFEFSHFGCVLKGKIEYATYHNNRNTCVQLLSWSDKYQDWDTYAKLSVNTEEILPGEYFVAKTYSENEGLIEQLIEKGIFKDTGKSIDLGNVVCPILQIGS